MPTVYPQVNDFKTKASTWKTFTLASDLEAGANHTLVLWKATEDNTQKKVSDWWCGEYTAATSHYFLLLPMASYCFLLLPITSYSSILLRPPITS